MSLPRARFAARLADRPLLADGGMGTLLFSRGIPQRACLDELAATRPDLVGTIHREYLDAGADLIETLTFGANRLRLDAFGLAAEAGRLNRRAAQVAREARDVSGRDAWVGGSIGPLGPPTRELRHPDDATIRAVYREQVDGLLEGGVDLLVIESFFDLHHLLLAVDEARRAADVPLIASMTFGEDLVLADGTTPAEALAALTDAGVDAVGVNCGVGPLGLPGRARPAGRRPRRRAGPLRSCPTPACRSAWRAASSTRPSPPTSGPSSPRLLDAGAAVDRRLLRHHARAHRGDGAAPSTPSPPRTGAVRRPARTPSSAPARSPGRVPAPPSRRPTPTAPRRGSPAGDPPRTRPRRAAAS